MEGKKSIENSEKHQHSIEGISSVAMPEHIKDAKYAIDPSKRKLFDDFVKRERELADGIGVTALSYANEAKKDAEKNYSLEQERFKEYTQQVEQLRNEIDIKKSNLITKLLEFRQIRDLKARLDLRKKIASNTENDLHEKKELMDAYEYMISEEKELIALTEKIQTENVESTRLQQLEYQEDEKKRTITDLTSKHSVFFVHDIVDAEWKPSANNRAVNTQKLDFCDQLDIVLGIAPTISVSTLKQNTKQSTFGRGSWGVFLSGGRVVGGEPVDAGTVAYGFRKRVLTGFDTNKTIEGIDRAINGDNVITRESGYNELVVEQPEIAGVYIKWGTEGWPEIKEGEDIFLSEKLQGGGDRYAIWWEEMSSTLKRGIPIFVLDQKNNHVRLVYDINVKNKTFRITPEYDPSHIVNMPGIYKQHGGGDEKRQAVMRVYNKISDSLSQEEREAFKPDGTEGDSRGFYSVH